MGRSASRAKERRKALGTLSQVLEQPANALIVHYSCESFREVVDRSRRITSIAVRHVGSGQTESFSIHLIGEERGLSPEQLGTCYDELEREMLSRFFSFVKDHRSKMWISWNMCDATYGFPALQHRLRVLGGQPEDIAEDHLINLSWLLRDIYGPKWIAHPHMESLMRKNGFSDRDFLNGEEESEAFKRGAYVVLHQSTLRKVNLFGEFARAANADTLRTDATWASTYGNWIEATGAWIRERSGPQIILFAATLVGCVVGIVAVVHP